VNKASSIIVASEAGIAVRSLNDISDAIDACIGTDGLILTENDLSSEFFNLSNGLAGELFQKFVNYGVRSAIIVPSLEPFWRAD
jgi:hypothetical protein